MCQTLPPSTLLVAALAPLAGAALAGIFGTTLGGNRIGRRLCHSLPIAGGLISFVLSAMTLYRVTLDGDRFDGTIYPWMLLGGLTTEIGFLVGSLAAMMMVVVSFGSLVGDLDTIRYQGEDEGYNRF